MFEYLLQLLKRFLRLGIDGDEDAAGGDETQTAETGADETAQTAETDETATDDLDSLIDTVEETVDNTADKVVKGNRENEAIRAARQRAQQAEEARIRAEATLETERRMRQPIGPTQDQLLWEQEEQRLRDAEASDLEKWQIRSNRTLRANTQASNNALMQASEIQDKNTFDRLEISNPKVYKLYRDKVEKALTDMRNRGQNAPRLALLRFVIGNDVMEGKLKSGGTKKAAAAKTESTVDRGRSPGARSDVSARGAKTEHQKRAERLRNVIL